jgi:ABC-type polysaccharide/polyol phosphate export permease
MTYNEKSAYHLLDSFRIQCRVIRALVLREIITRYGRHNIGFLWLIVEPLIYIALHPLIWALHAEGRFYGISSWGFALTGFAPFLLWRNMSSRCLNAIEPNRSLLHHRPIKILDIFIARILLEAAGATFTLIFLASILSFFAGMKLPHDILQVCFGWFMMIWFGASLGLFVGSFSESSNIIEKAWTPFTFVMACISGPFFLTDSLPFDIRQIILWCPPLSATEFIREGYFGPVVHFYYDMKYLAVCNLGLLFIGLHRIRVIHSKKL